MAILRKGGKFKGPMLYHRRVSLGMNLDQLAKKMGLSKTAVYQWESGVCKPKPSSMLALSKVLKVEPDYFFHVNAKS